MLHVMSACAHLNPPSLGSSSGIRTARGRSHGILKCMDALKRPIILQRVNHGFGLVHIVTLDFNPNADAGEALTSIHECRGVEMFKIGC